MEQVPLSNVAEGTGNKGVNYSAAGDETNVIEDSTPRKTDNTAIRTDEKRMIGQTISALNHLLIAGITIYIIANSFEKYSLFSWHPSCMTVGTFLLMAEAVMALSPDNILTTKLGRQSKVRMHWILQAIAAVLIFIGFLTIVINKNKHNKNHFQSVHAILGLITFILVILTSLGGVFALYSVKFRQLVKPVTVKLMHNIIGIITYFIGAVCLLLGLYSNWFETFGYTAKIICRTFVVVSAITTLQSPTKSAVYRIKNNFSRT
ncbi:transmembrane reductase CYB561D2 [Anabrus simplex]|uniref:transmembrane reductase CYB561D2 n=1 Tax=Anabrus simplex TaxID=316456 RepID=UPI0034DD6394